MTVVRAHDLSHHDAFSIRPQKRPCRGSAGACTDLAVGTMAVDGAAVRNLWWELGPDKCPSLTAPGQGWFLSIQAPVGHRRPRNGPRTILSRRRNAYIKGGTPRE